MDVISKLQLLETCKEPLRQQAIQMLEPIIVIGVCSLIACGAGIYLIIKSSRYRNYIQYKKLEKDFVEYQKIQKQL